MKLVDEAMTAVSTGEVAAVVPVGDILCRLLSACETALDLARAEQWMSVAGRFEPWSEFVSPVCRNHYGGILLAMGRWEDAERELRAAIETGKDVEFTMLTISRCADGRIVEEWEIADTVALLAQVGALPAPAQA